MKTSDLLEQNYVPYSEKPSIAVVKSKDGKYFPGVRVENISFPLSISAAQNALFCCLSEGHQPAVLLTTNRGDRQLAFWKEEFGVEIQELNQSNLTDSNFQNIRLEEDIIPKIILTELLDRAVVGESNFPVATLLETGKGYFSGVNIECSAWNMGLCAERVAIAKALTYGCKDLKKLHIHSGKGEFSSPCGACRQVIVEHMPRNQIHLHHADHSESIHFSADLLPHSFRSSSLTKL